MQQIVVVGGGIVGATSALLLSDLGFKVILLDHASLPSPIQAEDPVRGRIFALNTASKKLFESLGVWQKLLLPRVTAYQTMEVWEANGFGALQFEAKQYYLNELGFIVEEYNIQQALYALLRKQNVLLETGVHIEDIVLEEDSVQVSCNTGLTLKADLLIGADGAASNVRSKVGIPMTTRAYQQKAIVGTLTVDRPHRGVALQNFCQDSTIALLPLFNEMQRSFVWSLGEETARKYENLAPVDFAEKVQQYTQGASGTIVSIEDMQIFPLQYQKVERLLKGRVLLLGDAAYRTHPHAGLGLNIALKGVKLLKHHLQASVTKHTLTQLAFEIEGELTPLINGIDSLHRFFQSQNPFLKWARNMGLNIINQNALLKKQFLKVAMG